MPPPVSILIRNEVEENQDSKIHRYEHRKKGIRVLKFICTSVSMLLGFPGGSVVQNSPANAGDKGLIPGSGRSPGEGNGNPLQYSCLGNPMDRGAWRATVHGVTKELDTTERLKRTTDTRLRLCVCVHTIMFDAL